MSEATRKFSETWSEEAALSGQRVEEAEAPAPEPERGVDLRESITRLEYFADASGQSVRLGRVTMRDGRVVTIPKKLKRILYSESGEAAGMYEEVGQVEAAAAVTGLPIESLRTFLEVQDREAVERLEEAVAERDDTPGPDSADTEDLKSLTEELNAMVDLANDLQDRLDAANKKIDALEALTTARDQAAPEDE